VASIVFYLALDAGLLGQQFFRRYCTTHPIEYAEAVLFFVGMSALAIRATETAVQLLGLPPVILGPVPPEKQTPRDVPALLARLARLPAWQRRHRLVQRTGEALKHVARRGSAGDLEEHLQLLAERDADRIHAGFAFIRLVIWSIPILGFLGTVIGITKAMESLKPDALEQSMITVVAGLGLKFDTTAVALALSMIMTFAQFGVDRATTRLMNLLDDRTADELLGRFLNSPSHGDEGAGPRLGYAAPQRLEGLLQQQAELQRASLEEVPRQWSRASAVVAQELQRSLTAALQHTLRAHAQQLSLLETASAEKGRESWRQIEQAMAAHTAALADVHEGLVQKAEVLTRAVEAAGTVARLEETLNRNLAALAGSKDFENLVMSLTAAIHLLSARLGGVPANAPTIQLQQPRRTGQAA
jgi:biopolymer transport protein ExbB/TolQ